MFLLNDLEDLSHHVLKIASWNPLLTHIINTSFSPRRRNDILVYSYTLLQCNRSLGITLPHPDSSILEEDHFTTSSPLLTKLHQRLNIMIAVFVTTYIQHLSYQ